jgi:hypothetical protein
VEPPDCPAGEFRSADYLQAAAGLQALGRDEAVRKLEEWVEFSRCEEQVVILCRMLFVADSGKESAKPRTGRYLCHPGGTGEDDWPLEPIALFDDVPFLVGSGRVVAATAESASDYLKRCVRDLTWRTGKYQVRSPEQMKEIVHRFVAATNWKIPQGDSWRFPWIEAKFLIQSQGVPRREVTTVEDIRLDEAWRSLQNAGSNPLLHGFKSGFGTGD